MKVLDDDICGAPMTYLKQQFEVHYVKVIQPYMGRINRGVYQTLPFLNRLFEISEPLSHDMRIFSRQFSLQELDSDWQRYQRASKNHARQWSILLTKCSVSIGGKS